MGPARAADRALEKHGIYNERIARLQQEGIAALAQARQAIEERAYDRFMQQPRPLLGSGHPRLQ